MSAEEAKKALLAKTPPTQAITDSDYLSSGLTLLNLGCTKRTNAAFVKGCIYHLAGRKSSAKTFICKQILAEAARSPHFLDYELIYDDIEHGDKIDTEFFFGKKLLAREIAPKYSKAKQPIYSQSTMDFYNGIKARLDKNKKFVWIVDSLDALKSDNQTKMTDNKAKAHSQNLRELLDSLEVTKSMLFLVSQARVDLKSMFPMDIVAGGLALEHYPTISIKFQKIKNLRKIVNERKYDIGSVIKAQIVKNRISGNQETIFFPHYPTAGIDNLGANVDYLCYVKHWPKTKEGLITASEFNTEGAREAIIKKIEKEGQQRELEVLVGKVWRGIRQLCAITRDRRYT